jgi:hypothetical protein
MIFRNKCLFCDYLRLFFELTWHFKVPDTFSKLILNISMVMASVGSTTMNYYTFQFVNAVLRDLNRFRVKMRTQIKLKWVLEPIIHFNSLKCVIVKIKTIKIYSKYWWQFIYLLTFECVCLLIAIVAE